MTTGTPTTNKSLSAPVADLATGSAHQTVEKGIALCLSGGGYRAMVFHLGALWRLNELAYLPKLDRISSVSGGSITAGVLGMNWSQLAFDGQGVAANFQKAVVKPVRDMASVTVDWKVFALGLPVPGTTGSRLAGSYRKHLFGTKTLQDLPDRPRFVINSTNVQSGALWRFMKPYMRDYRVGEVKNPTIELATAIAASSAFPPFLSPVIMNLSESDFTAGSGMDLQKPPFTTRVVLTDGGTYDNLGLETAWKRYDTILVSDAGGKFEPEESPSYLNGLHAYRVLNLIDNQVRSLRKRQLIGSYVDGSRKGTYWGAYTDIANYKLPDALPCPVGKTLEIATISTRLKSLDTSEQEQLINWGYAVCDAAMRKHVDPSASKPADFPYPSTGVG